MVRDVYRGVLGRDPEDESVIARYAENGTQLAELLAAFLGSTEFGGRPVRSRSEGDLLFDGITREDENTLLRHLEVGAAEPGFVKNFLGVRQRTTFNTTTAGMSGFCFSDIPSFVGDLIAGSIEYVGTMKAIEAGDGAFVVIELGAGFGTWAVNAGHVAHRLGRSPIKLIAVEASPGKVANMHTHFADNGFDPREHMIVETVIGPRDGYAFFPPVDPIANWGGEAIFTDDERERPGYERVPSVALASLIADEPLVDLIHVDIQGAEADVLPPAIELLTQKVRYMVVATHARAIDAAIMELLGRSGWLLENEQVARVVWQAGKESLQADGTQVWRNPRL